MNPHLRYKVVLIAALALLTTRIGLGSLFSSASDITPNNVANAVNAERTSRNIPALRYNGELATAAQTKSQDMITRKYFAHVDPDGHFIWDTIVADGYTPYTVLGENLAINFSDTEGLISAWIDSPSHRENILNQNFADQGVGVASGDTSQNQYSIAVTNTFGAQPKFFTSPQNPGGAAQAPSPTPTPLPTLLTLPIGQNPTPTPRPTAVPKPKATPKPATTPKPTVQPTSPAPTAAQRAEPATIDINSVQITEYPNGDALDLHIQLAIIGAATDVNATVNGQSALLVPDGSPTGYSGDLLFDGHADLSDADLVLATDSAGGAHNTATFSLSNIPETQAPDSTASDQKTNAGSAAALSPGSGTTVSATQPQTGKATGADLYTLFKYIAIIFSTLLIILMVIDAAMHHKNKNTAAMVSGGNNIILLIILVGTLFFVSWWH